MKARPVVLAARHTLVKIFFDMRGILRSFNLPHAVATLAELEVACTGLGVADSLSTAGNTVLAALRHMTFAAGPTGTGWNTHRDALTDHSSAARVHAVAAVRHIACHYSGKASTPLPVVHPHMLGSRHIGPDTRPHTASCAVHVLGAKARPCPTTDWTELLGKECSRAFRARVRCGAH